MTTSASARSPGIGGGWTVENGVGIAYFFEHLNGRWMLIEVPQFGRLSAGR